MSRPENFNGMEIAVIGMAGRFPRAANLDAFWHNLSQATDCISFFSDQELEAAGVDRATLEDKSYVKAGGVLEDADLFDATFFGFNAREAEITDPQQRVFLECAWEAMENAGYAGANYKHLVGVYGGVSRNTYIFNLFANPDVMKSAGGFQLAVASDKDFLAPRVAYKLNLKGPAVVIQTACSTSLVAIHMACQGLLAGECQMALAGGVSIMFPQTNGYFYQAGGIYAPDGACRTFDAQSQGTVLGRGAGVVVLKRLEDALADGDHIRAIIKGSAINNDGAFKVGFTAPGLEGQTNVIRSAHGVAEVDPETISYVEAHGTATELGDPVEVLALTKAFRAGTNKKGFCALGSVKSNIGHTDAAAGVAGFIKTVLALEHRRIPPILHFTQPNPKIELDDSPFYVCARLTDWTTNGRPRRAGVSSFGIGGTNAHIILEEAPVSEPSGRSRLNQLLVLSAKTPSALEQLTNNFAAHLRSHPEQPLADIAFTAQVGREAFAYRRMLVSRDHESAAVALESRDPQRVLTLHSHSGDRPVVFLFPGQGTQYPEMALGLYHEERTFHDCVDECALKLLPHLGRDLREIMYPQRDQLGEADHWLRQTALAQPALFVIEYALAKLWMEWGIQPKAMIGHSLGEYVAGTLAGIMSLEDALFLVSVRGSLMQSMQPGAMLAVSLPEAEVTQLLGEDLSVAALNGPAMSVVSGPTESIEELERRLASLHITGRRLHTSHAFHSRMMDPMLERFADQVSKVHLQPPRIPLVSNLTGRWMSNEQAIDPNYWVRQVREAVRFGEGLTTLFEDPARVFLEIGPGATLSRLAGSHPDKPMNLARISSLPSAGEHDSDDEVLAGALGRLWLEGVEIDWQGFYAQQDRHRVILPTYPFERKRYWIDAAPSRNAQAEPAHAAKSLAGEDEAMTNPLPVESDRRARARHPRPEMLVTYAPPRDEREKRLSQIWEELLGVTPIGIHDNFFELGGHSLLATQMVAALRQIFGVEFPLRRIFETLTVAELASVLAIELTNLEETGQELAQWPTLVPDTINRHEPFPLTDVQQAYWVGRTSAFALGDVATHSYLEFENADLDMERFARAWQHLIDRHDMLRAIVLPDGQQQILKELPAYQIEVLNLQHATRENAETELLTLRRKMSHQVRPSDRWPLFEVRASLLPGGATRIHISFDLLIGDAWSWNILMFELFHFYQDGRPLPPLELSFRDYVLGEVELQKSATYERALAYWKNRLDSLPPAPDLPLRINPASLERPVFHRRSHQLPAEQWTQLKKRAVAGGLTPSGVLLAAFAETLAVWCSSPRFTLNLTLFNRLPLHPQVDRLIGDFTSLTLLEADCSEAGTFGERARKLQHRLFDDLDHRYFSAVRVMRELARHRPGGNAAMMPVVFTSTLALDEKRQDSSPSFALGEVVYSISQTPQVLLDHQVGEHEGSLVFNWDTVDDAFPAGLLDDIFHAYCGLLNHLAENETAWQQSSLNLVPASQLERYKAINDVTAAVPDDLLHTAFDRMAQKQPDQPAILWDGGALSYGELDRRSNQLARRLRRLGARPEKLIGVSLKKGWEQVVAVLAVLRAGGAYLPVDPSLPQERRFFLFQQGEIELAITRNAAQQEWPNGVQPLDVDDPSLEQEIHFALQPVQKPTDLAYVIFTSGSTGLPKGVMIEHHGALNTVLDINRRFHVGPGDRVLALSALGFDLSVYDIFGILAAGGAIVIPDDKNLREPAHWFSLMRQTGVSIWNSVPALMQMQADYLEGRGETLPETLRAVMLSGDWLPVTLPDQIRRIGGGPVQVTSLGGATEASIWSILYPIGEVDPAWASIPYGQPMDNQKFHVLNSCLDPCPIWTPGELYIGGIGLARGYWKDPGKTNASFITHPLTGERLYRTGDMGRWLPDGNIEFLGREDFQVKIQGYRVELGEIELTLGQHPQVKLAIVVAVGERRGAKRLVAYVLFKEETAPAEELSAFLRKTLPEYMVPSSFIALDVLPLTANGKVDRAALPLIDQQKSTSTNELIEPRDQVEREICRIWEEVLNVSPVGLGANFFELGGHSLLAVRLMNQIKRSLGANIPVSALFTQPTVEQIASLIRKEVHVDTEASLVPIQPSGSLPPFFWVHPIGGNVFCYAPLARALGKEQPFFAFQSRSQRTVGGKLEEMAAEYCTELQRVQPNGPYFLGGWSMGGVVAFEMARQLSLAGHQVNHLAIVDAWAPFADQIAMESDEASALIDFAGDLGIPLDRMNLTKLMSLDNESRLSWIFERAKAERILLPDDDLAHVSRLFEIFEHNRLVLATYVGKPYPGRITLFRASETTALAASDAFLGWGLLAEGGVELYEMEGSHVTVLSALHVSKLASTLVESVNAQRPGKPGTTRAVRTAAHHSVENGN